MLDLIIYSEKKFQIKLVGNCFRSKIHFLLKKQQVLFFFFVYDNYAVYLEDQTLYNYKIKICF